MVSLISKVILWTVAWLFAAIISGLVVETLHPDNINDHIMDRHRLVAVCTFGDL